MDTTTLILSAVAVLLLTIAFSRQRDLPLLDY